MHGESAFFLLLAIMCFWIAITGKGTLRFGGLATGPQVRPHGALRRVLIAAIGGVLAYLAYIRFAGKPTPAMLGSYVLADVLLMAIGVLALASGLRISMYRTDIEAVAVEHGVSPKFAVKAVATLAIAIGGLLLISAGVALIHHIL